MTDAIRNYESRLGDPASRRHGTFSYLPPMSAGQLRRQVEHIIARGWQPAIEHSEPERAAATYWYMWKLPMFGAADVDAVLAEVDMCRKAHPGHHVRLIGYDPLAQSRGTEMVVHRG